MGTTTTRLCTYMYMQQRTSGDVDEVLAGGAVDLDVALAEVVLVLAQRQVAVLLALEANQRLAVTPTLLTQTQRHAAPATHSHDVS